MAGRCRVPYTCVLANVRARSYHTLLATFTACLRSAPPPFNACAPGPWTGRIAETAAGKVDIGVPFLLPSWDIFVTPARQPQSPFVPGLSETVDTCQRKNAMKTHYVAAVFRRDAAQHNRTVYYASSPIMD